LVVGFIKRLLTDDRSDERRHREQVHAAWSAVRWTKISVAVAVISLAVTAAIAWIPHGDGEEQESASADQANSADPLAVAVETFKSRCDFWFVPGPIDQIDFGSGGETAIDWPDLPAGAGGAPASPFWLFFTVQGRTEAEVVLTDLDIEVLERRQAPAGVVLQDSCGDQGAFRWLGIDLDSDPPQVISHFAEGAIDPADETVTERELQPVRFPYHVSVTEGEVFSVAAYAVNCDCEWTIRLSWQSQGRSGTKIVDDDGRPFRTVGMSNATAHCFGDGSCEPIPDYYAEISRPPGPELGDFAIPLG
jgi:hypothetical protein